MPQKIAIAILHGAGTPKENFADEMVNSISKGFAEKSHLNDSEQPLVFESVFWSSIFEREQEELWERVQRNAELDFPYLRRFAIEFLADAIAYQPTTIGNQNYDKVHALFAESLRELKKKAGPKAPLCVVSHSLGSIIASNYFFDMQYRQEKLGVRTKGVVEDTPMEKGETLALFYTMGSPMALWSLRYIDFGSPISIPSPLLNNYHPNLKGEWLNFYDKDDVLSFPLKALNDIFQTHVTEDVAVNAGGLLTSWNPLSHINYSSDNDVIEPIVNGLLRTWNEMNR
ncbi:chemotaxis protein [Virgibacillus ndiopensis]|uniref:chemotaxis protein n=1 Tax=Virgibacillus ndiopensis TaxID=2004408 RepID=UPI000C0701E1|nr:chemotaxis protein [Virgibacillus ndiopensis]